MKNKKFGLILLMAGSLLLTNCTKNKTNEPPSPDYETQSTKDLVELQMIMADIIEIGGQAHDGVGLSPYINSTLTSVRVGTNNVPAQPITVTPNTSLKYYYVTFTNTPGNDGHLRNGELYFDYSATTSTVTASAIKYSTPGFVASVTSTTNNPYTIDDKTITINSMTIRNTTHSLFPAAPKTPSTTSLTWDISADINVTGPGGTKNIKGDWTKTLLNTGNQAVPMPFGSQTFTITSNSSFPDTRWYFAHVSYSGTGSGNTGTSNLNYTLKDVTRNFNSSPEGYKYIKYTAPNPMAPTYVDAPERHPFLSGMMTFKDGSKPTREVDFGVGNVVDYNAKVNIQGVTYDVDCNN